MNTVKGCLKTCVMVAVVAVPFLMTSCSGVKRCAAPDLNLPERIVAGHGDSLTMADVKWWDFYTDPSLTQLIEKALANNRDMLSAMARVEEMRALYGVSKANQLPELTARLSGDNETNDYYGEKSVSDAEFGLKATVSWEIDFWGRLKWAKNQGKWNYLASVEARRAMQMTLVSEVAAAYFRLVALDNELSIVRRTLTTRQEGINQARLRYEGGLTSEMVYRQAQVEYATTATLVPALESEIEITMNALNVLTGEYPGQTVGRSKMDTELYLPDSLSIGLPSTLLQRRPDVKVAEAELRAAMASVGMTYADRFPRFTIALTGGLESDELKHFLRSPFSYVIGSIAGPVFDFGRRKKKYEASVAVYEQTRLAYEQKVLEVFRETSDAVTAYRSARSTAALRTNLRDAARKYVDLAHIQYRAGSINYIDVLDAQRRYFDAQIGLSNAVRDEHLALVALYKTLGGGW